MWRLLLILSLAPGCAPAGGMRDGGPAQKYADGMEYYVPSNSGAMSRSAAAPAGVTQYFQINTGRVCFSFQMPGTWEAGQTVGTLTGKLIDGVPIQGSENICLSK